VWQFPGGYQEYGESFEQTAKRELEEECGVSIALDRFKFVTVMNVLFTEHGYHNVGIFMFVKVLKSEFEWKLMEPEKNTAWGWIAWADFVPLETKFIPFKYFFEQGFSSLDKIKALVGELI
jgi:8-oxo-dGTP pyrophosphatase MutT (NUDIX family)